VASFTLLIDFNRVFFPFPAPFGARAAASAPTRHFARLGIAGSEIVG
jgi:hypothetical protein